MRPRGLGLVLYAAACGSSPATRDAPPAPDAGDAPGGPVVSGRLVEIEVRNTPAGSGEVRFHAVDPARVMLTAVLLDTGTTTHPAISDSGLFAFPRARDDEAYEVTIAFDGDVGVAYQATAPSLQLELPQLGREDAVAAPAGANIDLTVQYSIDATIAVESTGVYSHASVPGSPGMLHTSLLWPATTPVAPQPAPELLDAAAGDRLVILEEHARPWPFGPNAQYSTVLGAATESVTLGGSAATVSATIANLPPLCTQLVSHPNLLAAEVGSAQGSSAASPVMATDTWKILAAPGPGAGPSGLLELASFFESTPSDGSGAVVFGDPYPGTELVAEALVQVPRPDNTLLPDGVFALVPIAGAACDTSGRPVSATELPAQVPIPAIPTLGERDAGAQGRVHVRWTPSAAGSADAYLVILSDVSSGQPVRVAAVVTTAIEATFPGSAVAPGVPYVVTVAAEQGLPYAGTGDFSQLAYPFLQGQTTSAVTVGPP